MRSASSIDRCTLARALPILAIVGLAVVLRLSAISAWPVKPISDAAEYHGLAARLTQGLGFVGVEGVPTAFRAPLYPAFVAGTYALAGVDPQKAAVAQAILGGITVAPAPMARLHDGGLPRRCGGRDPRGSLS